MDEAVDLSALDPSRDTKRWDRLIASVAGRALASRRQRMTVSYQLLSWARPTLAVAAAAALAVWAGALLGGQDASHSADPAIQLAQWAHEGEAPEPSKVLRVLGGTDELE
jgi:hypothetical protein